MNTEDRQTAERRVAAWLNYAAPEPPTDLAGRLLRTTTTLPQRTRGGIFDMFNIRLAATAVVVAAAAVIGLAVANVIGPEPPVGTSPPSASAPSSPEASATPAIPPTSSTQPSEAPAAGAGRIAFQADRGNSTSGIYLMDPDGSNVVQLVDDPAFHELAPIWSPDGSLITYHTSSADGSMQGGVFVIDPGGGSPVLVDDNFAYGPATWSPDGSMLIVGGDGAARGISVYHVSEGRLEPLTDDGGNAPIWSPDGSAIAYNVVGPSSNEIAIVEVGTGEVRVLTDDEWSDSVARWTDDGRRLAFTSDRETDRTRDAQRSWVIDVESGELELLGDGQLLARASWTSPNGEWIAYAADDGTGLRLSRVDGSEDGAVHPDVPADFGPSWAPDSSGFVFSDTPEAGRDIWVMRVDAEGPVQLTTDAADESSPNWGPSG